MIDDETTSGVNLGRMLRGLRRRADLSQRQLAARAGVPQATIARIEAATVRDPAWRTVERLVRAMDAELVVTTSGDQRRELPAVPHEEWRDTAGRHYAAHLDAVPVLRPERWWGAWWASSVARSQWPLHEVPGVTFDLSRSRRDERRGRAALGATVAVRWTGTPTEPVVVAESAGGAAVGEVRGRPFTEGVEDDAVVPGTVVLEGCFVRCGWRRLGVGRRMVEALASQAAGPVTAMAFTYTQRKFLEACGFTQTRRLMPPTWYVHPGPAGAWQRG